MTVSDGITLGAFVLSIIASIYSFRTNTKSFELSSQYKTELMNWYAETVEILIRLKMEVKNGDTNEKVKRELLSKLSTKIEIGRFYFPNIVKGDGFGDEKPIAYRGYRHLMTGLLIYSYRLFEKPNAGQFLEHAESLQRHFTSQLFEIIEPSKFLKEAQKHTKKEFSKELIFEDFLKSEPSKLDFFVLKSLN